MKIKRKKHSVPTLEMVAMPDLIFTILFFFMIVTHVRENSPEVRYTEPQGTNLQKVKKNSSVIDVFVGRSNATGDYEIQVNNRLVSLDKLPYVLRSEREQVLYDDDQVVASLQADRQAPMEVINKVKMALREANILKINYGGTDAPSPQTAKK